MADTLGHLSFSNIYMGTLPRFFMLKLASGDYACCLWETQSEQHSHYSNLYTHLASHGRPVIIFDGGRPGLDFGLGTRFKVESCSSLCLGL